MDQGVVSIIKFTVFELLLVHHTSPKPDIVHVGIAEKTTGMSDNSFAANGK